MPYADPEKARAAAKKAQARRMTDPGYRERYNTYHREWNAKNQINTRRNHKSLYGLSRSDYNLMVMLQCGGCAICGRVPSENPDANPKARSLVVDHDHGTRGIRDLLCVNCNLMLGHSAENAGRLEAGARYLREWENAR